RRRRGGLDYSWLLIADEKNPLRHRPPNLTHALPRFLRRPVPSQYVENFHHVWGLCTPGQSHWPPVDLEMSKLALQVSSLCISGAKRIVAARSQSNPVTGSRPSSSRLVKARGRRPHFPRAAKLIDKK